MDNFTNQAKYECMDIASTIISNRMQDAYGENLTCFPNLIMKCSDSPLLDCKNYSGVWSVNKSYQWMHENSNKILWKAKNNNWQIGDREDFEFDSSGIFAAGYSCPYDTTKWYKLVDGETWKEIPNFYIETKSKARCLKKIFALIIIIFLTSSYLRSLSMSH